MVFSESYGIFSKFADDQKYTKYLMLLLVILPPLLFITLYILASMTNPTFYIPARIIFSALGPLLTFIFVISFPLWAFQDQLQNKLFRSALLFVSLGGILGVMFALSINSRSIFLILIFDLLGIGGDILFRLTLFVAVLVPLIEEFAKFFPVYLVARLMLINSKGEEQRYINNPRVILYFAIITGAIFNLLETYHYTWSIGNIYMTNNPSVWNGVVLQIIIRSINPLHIAGSILCASTLVLALNNSLKEISPTQSLSLWRGYIFAVILHGLWNAAAINSTTLPHVIIAGIPISWINILLIGVSVSIFAFTLYIIIFWSPRYCETCGLWHKEELHDETIFAFFKTSLKSYIGLRQYKCTNCSARSLESNCNVCNSTKLIRCGNCYNAIPVYENKCWSCKSPIEPIYNDILNVSTKGHNLLIQGLLLILVSIYLPITFYQFYNISRGELSLISDNYLTSGIIFLIFSIALLIIFLLTFDKKYKGIGLILGKFALSILLIQIAVFFFLLGFFGQTITIILATIISGSMLYLIFNNLLTSTELILE
jgi:RsiW-degrading membrane proteinase PrsW (M82 family)